MKALPFPVDDTKASVVNLEEGSEVEFRVTAVNEAGAGAPSKVVGPHLVRDPVCMRVAYVTTALSLRVYRVNSFFLYFHLDYLKLSVKAKVLSFYLLNKVNIRKKTFKKKIFFYFFTFYHLQRSYLQFVFT